MLISLKEHARQRPEMTKKTLNSNPILTHAIVQCFKSRNIPILALGEASSALLLAPPPLAPQFESCAPRNAGGFSSRWSARSNSPQEPAPAGTALTSNIPSHSRGNIAHQVVMWHDPHGPEQAKKASSSNKDRCHY
uniref:AlNc14C242G9480 protein n=1 Tax=Albugo laibachii Nc14 TaxID=890382 RepID=F0WSZ0_9STRA|nr:AlNc14C242G9480 [Albugo laibachii Nc14]|eukprot:CCA24475.1 AlNc14C242G9480 [Albugo laibachii Nc14]